MKSLDRVYRFIQYVHIPIKLNLTVWIPFAFILNSNSENANGLFRKNIEKKKLQIKLTCRFFEFQQIKD